MAMGMGARVTVLDRSLPRLRTIDELYGNRLTSLYASSENIEQQLPQADVVIGTVLVPGALTPKLISRSMLGLMKPGSVLVDVAIDQGGCFETSRPTSHEAPSFVLDGIVHYAVTNMPGAVARTATFALTNATLPYVLQLANEGITAALCEHRELRHGLNIYRGQLCCQAVAEAQAANFVTAEEALACSSRQVAE
jgi:alanine dehydrogenase